MGIGWALVLRILQSTLVERVAGRRAATAKGGLSLPLVVWIPKPGGPWATMKKWEGQTEERGVGKRIRWTKSTARVTVRQIKLLPVTSSVNEAVMTLAVTSKPLHVGRAGTGTTGTWGQVRELLSRALWCAREKGRIS